VISPGFVSVTGALKRFAAGEAHAHATRARNGSSGGSTPAGTGCPSISTSCHSLAASMLIA